MRCARKQKGQPVKYRIGVVAICFANMILEVIRNDETKSHVGAIFGFSVLLLVAIVDLWSERRTRGVGGCLD